MMNRAQPIDYRGFSIEQERDGSYSVYRFGYISGHHKNIEVAKKDVDWRAE